MQSPAGQTDALVAGDTRDHPWDFWRDAERGRGLLSKAEGCKVEVGGMEGSTAEAGAH